MEKIVFAKDITLYKADCLEVMPFLPESSIDLVLCDPPFGITASQWDKIIPFPEMWKEIRRVRKENAPTVLFGSEPFSSFLRCGNLDEFKYDWVWEKSKASNFLLAKKQPLKAHELISVFGNPLLSNHGGRRALREPHEERKQLDRDKQCTQSYIQA